MTCKYRHNSLRCRSENVLCGALKNLERSWLLCDSLEHSWWPPWPEPSEKDSFVVSFYLCLWGAQFLFAGSSREPALVHFFSSSLNDRYILSYLISANISSRTGFNVFSITSHDFFSTIWSSFRPRSLRVYTLWFQYLNKTVLVKVCSWAFLVCKCYTQALCHKAPFCLLCFWFL